MNELIIKSFTSDLISIVIMGVVYIVTLLALYGVYYFDFDKHFDHHDDK